MFSSVIKYFKSNPKSMSYQYSLNIINNKDTIIATKKYLITKIQDNDHFRYFIREIKKEPDESGNQADLYITHEIDAETGEKIQEEVIFFIDNKDDPHSVDTKTVSKDQK